MSWMSPATVPIRTVPIVVRLGGLGEQLRLHQVTDRLHHLARDDELREEVLLLIEAVADDGHRLAGSVEDHLGILAGVEHGLDQAHRLVLVHVGDCCY